MERKNRLLLLILCVICFLVIAPILVLYSMGDRFDLEKMKIVKTGGIYVRTFPAAALITVDSKIPGKPGVFGNSIFVQSLLPKNHSILVEKDGYYEYHKTLDVQENEVTKLENVILFKKEIIFEPLADQTASPFLAEAQQAKYAIKNNNLYYSETPQNSKLSAATKKAALLKNLAVFETSGSKILWLGTDGFLYQYEISGLPIASTETLKPLNLTALKINKKGGYKIITDGQNIFLDDNGKLFILDNKTGEFASIADSVKSAQISPDGKNLTYASNNKVYIYAISGDPARDFLKAGQINILYESKNPVSNVLWLNNDYVVFASGDNVIISEIDFRGNVNSVALAQKAEQIYFNRQNNKLYILSGEDTFVSEKLVP